MGHCWVPHQHGDVARASTWWRQQRTRPKGEPTVSQIPLLGTAAIPLMVALNAGPSLMPFYSVHVWPSRDQLQFPLQVQPAFNIHGMMFPGERTFFKQSTVCIGQKLSRESRPEISKVHGHIWLKPYLLPQGASNFFSMSFELSWGIPTSFTVQYLVYTEL